MTGLDAALELLERGGVVAAATESFFGLLADATRPSAIDALLSLKPRGAEKGIPLILPSVEAWDDVATAIPETARRLGRALWPGPLTIAVPGSASVDPRTLLDGRIAVRLPGLCPAAQLASRFGRALTATSANPPGMPPTTTDAEVRKVFPDAPSDVLHIVPGEAGGGAPSTIVVVHDAGFEVVRVGPYSEAQVRAAAGVDPTYPRS